MVLVFLGRLRYLIIGTSEHLEFSVTRTCELEYGRQAWEISESWQGYFTQ